MNKEKVKGTLNDAAGRAKRQAGEWTGNINTQAEGAAQQMKGKAQKAVGAIKDAAQNARINAEREHAQRTQDRQRTARP